MSVEPAPGRGRLLEVFRVFLKLGLTSFGGPVAHLGYYRNELVQRRQWIDEAGFADLVALCQFLPGPASSQVGFSLGVLRGGGLLGIHDERANLSGAGADGDPFAVAGRGLEFFHGPVLRGKGWRKGEQRDGGEEGFHGDGDRGDSTRWTREGRAFNEVRWT